MKTKSIVNILAFAFLVSGLLLKANHLAGANIAIILSSAIMLSSLFLFALKDNKESGMTDTLNYLLIGSVSFWIISTLFKFMHWPGSQIIAIIGYTLAFLLPIIFIFQKQDFKISKQFFITFLTFFILIIGLIPHNPISRFLGDGDDYTVSEEYKSLMKHDSIIKSNEH